VRAVGEETMLNLKGWRRYCGSCAHFTAQRFAAHVSVGARLRRLVEWREGAGGDTSREVLPGAMKEVELPSRETFHARRRFLEAGAWLPQWRLV
jgi:hypothetical protein